MQAATQEYGVVLESGAVRFERLLPGPIERVWAYLTESDKRATWFAGGDFDLRPGGEAKLLFKHSVITDEAPPERYREMNDNGIWGTERILRCEPPHVLAFTWGGENEPDSEVTFELAERGDKVSLVLTHRQIASVASMRNFSGGWHIHLGILEDILANRPKRGFWSAFETVEAEYARRIGEETDERR